MLNFVLGPSGSGKTKWLIDKANEEVRKGNGNIIFINLFYKKTLVLFIAKWYNEKKKLRGGLNVKFCTWSVRIRKN